MTIYRYIRDLFSHWVNVYSIFSILICIVCFSYYYIDPSNNSIGINLSFLFLIISFFVANYFAWKDLHVRFLGELKIKLDPHYIRSGFIGDGDVLKSSRWIFDFDITNSTNENQYLNKYELHISQYDEELLPLLEENKFIISEKVWSDTPISTPFLISQNSKTILKGQIPVQLTSGGPESFAKKLNNIKSFKATFTLYFEDLNGIKHTKEINFTDNFEHFVSNVKSYWKKHEKFEKLFLLSNQKEHV